jgi:NADH-ubiquinone oxidoreductase chain 5
LFSIFFGFLTKDIFIGLGTGFFIDNGLYINPYHEITVETEFAVPILFKLLPLIFTIFFTFLSILYSEILPSRLINFKLTRVGYNIFGFFSQRFLVEFFYNKYITNKILEIGGETTKIIDKGSIEYLGPFGLEVGLTSLSKNISKLDSGVITSYALYILSGLFIYIFISYLMIIQNIILIMILFGFLVITKYSYNK